MQRKAPKPGRPIATPHLPKDPVESPLPIEPIAAGEHFSDLILHDWQSTDVIAAGVTVDEVILTRANLARTQLRRLHLRDARLQNADLSNAEWPQLVATRVEFFDCRLTGWKLIEGQLDDVVLRDCKADLSQFRFARCQNVRFEQCNLRDADFQGADLRGVVFVNCDLSGVMLHGAKLSGTDLRGSKLEGLRVQPEDLKGAIIDSGQVVELAFQLANLLGMIVHE